MLSAPLQLNTVRDLIEMRFTNFVQLWTTKVNNFLQRLEASSDYSETLCSSCYRHSTASGSKIERLNFHLGPKNWRFPNIIERSERYPSFANNDGEDSASWARLNEGIAAA